MPRSTDEWHGSNPDTSIPPRVRLRIFERYNGHCAQCGRTLRPGHYAFDHIKALINGGTHSESNLQPLCDVPCHQNKTADDVKQKSVSYRKRRKRVGIRQVQFRPLPGTRASGIRKRMNGSVERW